jgi:GT2 family glycosyltransferase
VISFVLLNWNSGPYLDRCLHSLERQTSTAWELIAVDNGSSNESLELLRARRDSGLIGELVEIPSNRGYAAGMNAGIARARGDVIVPLNSDVFLATDFVAVVQAAVERDTQPPGAAQQRTGMWAVPVYDWQFEADGADVLTNDLHTVGVSLVRRLSVSPWHPQFDSVDTLIGPEGSAPILSRVAVDAACARAGCVYDESYGSYGEDIDLYVRLHALGFRCRPCLGTAIWHIGSASTGGVKSYNRKPRAVQLMAQRNRVSNYAKLAMPGKRLGVLPWVVLDDLSRIVLVPARRELARSFFSEYRRLFATPPIAYPLERLPFAGAVFSRSGRWRQRHGSLPPLAAAADRIQEYGT